MNLNQAFGNNIREIKDKALEQSREAGKKIEADVKDKPWIYLGVTALLSVVLGFLLGRKSKD